MHGTTDLAEDSRLQAARDKAYSIPLADIDVGDPELFALLECADVFLYLFPEGLTTRRSSVLTSVEAGRPVLVHSAPLLLRE